jgi:beta-glucosidase
MILLTSQIQFHCFDFLKITGGKTFSMNIEKQITDLIKDMSLEEKASLLSGEKGFYLKGIERLDIPPIKMTDGPMGVVENGEATAFPANIGLTASWNKELARQMGEAIGNECCSKGIGFLLAPGVNIYRIPQNGRNFEYMGEDPFLASEMVVPYITGVQSQNVAATVKHFACNNQDFERNQFSSDLDERTLREIYLPAFKAAVQKADVQAVMTAYNPINGIHASENKLLIKDILKDEWGFEGIVMSDWTSVYSTRCIEAGLDLEMPSGEFMNPTNIIALVRNRFIEESDIDDKVRRILRVCLKSGLYEKNEVKVNWQKHADTAKQIALEGSVLLKNEDTILPLDFDKLKSIAVVGPNAHLTPLGGGGAALVQEFANQSILEGIQKISPHEMIIKHFLYEDIDVVKLIEYDAVIIAVGFNKDTEGEGFDRPFQLPQDQEILLRNVTKNHAKSIVLVVAGGGIDMSGWINDADAVLHCWYPGQEGGDAIAEILTGKENPSGKLPISIEKKWQDSAAFESYNEKWAEKNFERYNIQGKAHQIWSLQYEEGIFVGYRHFDKNNIEPLFAFGFGLSYTKFKIDELKIKKLNYTDNEFITFSVKVTNTGNKAGSETVQAYVHDVECTVSRPPKELKAFDKVFLEPGKSKEIVLKMKVKDLAFFHPWKREWIVEPGEFELLVGNSSRDDKMQKLKFSINR